LNLAAASDHFGGLSLRRVQPKLKSSVATILELFSPPIQAFVARSL
jgi:hypothetical protein